MRQTGARAAALAQILDDCGIRARTKPSAPRRADLTPDVLHELEELFHQLGGRGALPILRPGPWDLAAGEVLVELDEEQHFNRYRATTLSASWSTASPWAEDYARLCAQGEEACRKGYSNRGYWSNPSAERWFGPPAPQGDLKDPQGAPRWKQRAFYDAMKDAYAVYCPDARLARLSVYDMVSSRSLESILRGAPADRDALITLIESRTVTV